MLNMKRNPLNEASPSFKIIVNIIGKYTMLREREVGYFFVSLCGKVCMRNDGQIFFSDKFRRMK